MGLLEKLKLVETVDEENHDFSETEELEWIDEPVPVNIPEENTDTIVSDIYHENQMEDMSKSIFKVEELINSLPKEMPTSSKLSSVKAILKNFGIVEEMVLDDSEKREITLNAALLEIVNRMQKEISDKEQEIESYKEKISNLEKEISELNGVMDDSKRLIESEIERIVKLKEFIQGKG